MRDFFFTLQNHDGVYAGNDSGPSHMAAMLGIETHAWFLSTSSTVWAPLGPSKNLLFRLSAQQNFVGYRIDKGFPTRSDDIIAYPTVPHV